MPQLRDFGCHLRAPNFEFDTIMEFGIMLEKYGFDILKIGDHTLTMNSRATYPHAHTVLTAIAVLTKKIKLSAAVMDPYRRHPVEIAQELATLDQLSGGRVSLGIGGGEMMNLTPFGIEWDSPVMHLREAIEVIRLLWRADPSNPARYAGRVYSLDDAYLQIRPVQQGGPKVYVGAVGPATRRLAGMKGDGWMPIPCESPETLKMHAKDLWEGAKKAGRDPTELDVVSTIYTDVNDDYEKAYQHVEPVTKGLLVLERSILRLLGHDVEIPEELSFNRILVNDERAMARFHQLVETVPRRIVEATVAIGNADQCISAIERFLDAGSTSIVICNLGPDLERTYRAYSEKIIPYLREKYSGGQEEGIAPDSP